MKRFFLSPETTKCLESYGPTKFIIQTIFNNKKFSKYTVSILSRRACRHLIKSKEFGPTCKLDPPIHFHNILIVGFRPFTGVHIGIYNYGYLFENPYKIKKLNNGRYRICKDRN